MTIKFGQLHESFNLGESWELLFMYTKYTNHRYKLCNKCASYYSLCPKIQISTKNSLSQFCFGCKLISNNGFLLILYLEVPPWFFKKMLSFLDVYKTVHK